MSRYGSDFPEPPWTYAPKEVEAWLTSVAQGAKVSRFDAFRNVADHTLENVEIVLDVDAAKTRISPSNNFLQWMQDLTGRAKFESHFEIPAVAELLARALAKARYHSITKVTVDGRLEHNNAARPKDVRGTIELLTESSHRATRCEAVQFDAVDDEIGDTTAQVTVRKILKKGEHAIHVRFLGAVVEEDFRTFLSYLSQNLNATFVYNNGVQAQP
jgi:thymidylate synthase ThyX